jgi:hypothetical protein
MSAARRVGSSPDVELAKTTEASAARLAAASRSRLTPSRSGALSCTNAAPSAASSGVRTTLSAPSSGSGASVSRRSARRAFASISPATRSASGDGS